MLRRFGWGLFGLCSGWCLLLVVSAQEPAGNPLNEPVDNIGVIPLGEDGKPLNLNFETGTLKDWTATGKAFDDQPIKGEIDKNRIFGEGKKAELTGQFWIGGFEKHLDAPVGTLSSAPFVVNQPYASFLIGGGRHPETRVELVSAETKKPIFTAHGQDQENLRPVIVDLRPVQGQKIFIRIVDEHTGGWGHVNFDDFRLYSEKPRFKSQVINTVPTPSAEELYPHAGLAADDAAKAMQVPEGFTVQVGAGEPDVQQPIAIAVDDRGRVWVAEAYEYPRRAPEGQGKDRILIFEDTDLDGSLDRRTVFAENLNLVSGMEVGFGGVFVGAAPYLLFIPDRDQDDKPDGPPEVLLDGWAYQDTHETLNAFIWGPDGWLYGCHGVFTHSRVGKPGTPDAERVPLNAGIWRYHPTAQTFEVFAQGTSNPWGVDFNSRGDAFCTACVIPHLFHIIPGARYERQAGEHFNKFTYQDIKTIARHRHYTGNQWNDDNRRQSDELGGGHAHAGALIYQGGSWPEKYYDQILMNNIHGNRVNMDVLGDEGSGYFGDRAPDFLLTRDQWSQMLYLTLAPDGQVWAIDWYDRNQCHHGNVELHDRSNGRIYRISYAGTNPVAVDLKKLSDEELVSLVTNANEWNSRHARRLLQERAAAAGKPNPAVQAKLVELVQSAADERHVLRGMWALHVSGGVPAELSQKLLQHSNPSVRSWAIRLLASAPKVAPEVVAAFAKLAGEDSSPVVRLALASALQKLPANDRWDTLAQLVRHGEDAHDHNLPLMYWYALEPLTDVDARRALALGLSAGDTLPLLKEFVIRKIGSGDPEKSLGLLVEGLSDAKDAASQLTFLRGLNEALRGRRNVAPPDQWSAVSRTLLKSEDADVRGQTESLAATFGDPQVLAQLRQTLADPRVAAVERQRALAILGRVQDAESVPLLRALLKEVPLRSVAIRTLAQFDDADTPAAVLSVYHELAPGERRDALATLCSRVTSAKVLLHAIEQGQIPAAHLTADLITQLRNLKDDELSQLIEKSWGQVRDTAADKLQLMVAYKQRLSQPTAEAADPVLGRAVFAKTCQQCHTLFGSGAKVGPDLTGSNRANLDYLLSNVLDPSAVMAKEYQPVVLALNSGRVVTGLVKETRADALVITTSTEELVVPKDEIDEQTKSEKSMMPDDLLRTLSWQEVRSLVAYLASPGQVPQQATTDNLPGFFDGQTLKNWVGNSELWSVENGEIVGKAPKGLSRNEFLINELSLEDFKLTVEVKLVDNAGNSGIQFRSQPLADGEVKGYQADVGVGWWGKLYEEHGRALLWDKSGEEHVKPGEWNKYEIMAVGSRIRTWINGQPCVELDDSAGARRGVIALQLHSGGPTEVRFRNFAIALLGYPKQAGPFPASAPPPRPGEQLKFKRAKLDDKFRSEGVAYGDFNNDGQLDIAAGSVWYEAPEWKMHVIGEKANEFNIRTYGDTFCNWAEDVDGDGKQDLIVVDFPGRPTWWFQNPGNAGGPWAKHQIVPVTNDESPTYLDIDGDGRRELLYGDATGRACLARPGPNPLVEWQATRISAPGDVNIQAFYHGIGAGDVNQDGRLDVVVPNGWWAAPAKASSEPWEFHAAPLGEAQAQMYVFDFDGDGDQDVVGSSAHRRGVWWYEQTADGWKTHVIDTAIAQTHAMCLADMNGDGLPDLVTGKRYYAHNGRDPGEDEPPFLAWYELRREGGTAQWTPHVIDKDSGVGTHFEVVDMNRDGRLDVIVANKHGVYYFEQEAEPAAAK